MTKLAAILDQIDSGSALLPEFQRGYVWNRDQVRGLMRSLYLGYLVGGLLTWETQSDSSLIRGDAAPSPTLRALILDGQQRVTSLYGITRGRPPAFFQGDERAFTGLGFNVEDETCEFYAPAKMRDDPRWIDVTSLFTLPLEHHIGTLNADPETQPRIVSYMERLARLKQVLERDFHELAIADACWLEGLQPGQGDPVILVLDPEEADLPRLKELGYEVFTSVESLRGYVRRRNQEAVDPLAESTVSR